MSDFLFGNVIGLLEAVGLYILFDYLKLKYFTKAKPAVATAPTTPAA